MHHARRLSLKFIDPSNADDPASTIRMRLKHSFPLNRGIAGLRLPASVQPDS